MTPAASGFAKPVRSALDLIGNTPLLELTRFDTGPCRLFAKLKSQNPGGSIKDRIGLSLSEAAGEGGTSAAAPAGPRVSARRVPPAARPTPTATGPCPSPPPPNPRPFS